MLFTINSSNYRERQWKEMCYHKPSYWWLINMSSVSVTKIHGGAIVHVKVGLQYGHLN